ncbi:low molecular weight protein-tyrosine-phosphatase [Capnocytophaga sp. ARDL2]|uniref:low molecular weight protein-tyrosine-phosphatase n=1 Tax=Capnocytophaga sp. ARDL2 TaxID=3238809 RepID=UPI003555D662
MKVLMVCLGNICRSPLAEGILQSKVDTTKVTVDSAGTAAWHSGEKPDKRSIAVAKKYGIDISHQRARNLTVEDFELFDKIYVMDRSNYINVCRLAPNEKAVAKVEMILNEVHPDSNVEVPDPYYRGDQGFEKVFAMLDEACTIIQKKINQEVK